MGAHQLDAATVLCVVCEGSPTQGLFSCAWSLLGMVFGTSTVPVETFVEDREVKRVPHRTLMDELGSVFGTGFEALTGPRPCCFSRGSQPSLARTPVPRLKERQFFQPVMLRNRPELNGGTNGLEALTASIDEAEANPLGAKRASRLAATRLRLGCSYLAQDASGRLPGRCAF